MEVLAMETEAKYQLLGNRQAEALSRPEFWRKFLKGASAAGAWNGDQAFRIEEDGFLAEAVDYRAVYFESAKNELAALACSVRLRREGGKVVASAKWPLPKQEESLTYLSRPTGTVDRADRMATDAVSSRGEWNYALTPGEAEEPFSWPQVLKSAPLPASFPPALYELLLHTHLEERYTAAFQRRTGMLLWRRSWIELAIDCGQLLCHEKKQSLHELELELKSGTEADLISLCQALEKDTGIQALTVSKFARLLLMEKEER